MDAKAVCSKSGVRHVSSSGPKRDPSIRRSVGRVSIERVWLERHIYSFCVAKYTFGDGFHCKKCPSSWRLSVFHLNEVDFCPTTITYGVLVSAMAGGIIEVNNTPSIFTHSKFLSSTFSGNPGSKFVVVGSGPDTGTSPGGGLCAAGLSASS